VTGTVTEHLQTQPIEPKTRPQQRPAAMELENTFNNSHLLDTHWASAAVDVPSAATHDSNSRSPSQSPTVTDRRCDAPVTEQRADVSSESLLIELRREVNSLSDVVRSNVQDAVKDLTQAQSSATRSQGEVLRTLTEAIFTSSASQGLRRDDVESLLFALETRLNKSFRQVLSESGLTSSAAQPSAASVPASMMREQGGNSRTAAQQAVHALDLEESKKPISPLPARTWDEIRRELMSENGQESNTQTPDGRSSSNSQSITSPSDSSGTAKSSGDPMELLNLDEFPDVPLSVDPDTLSETELRTTMQAREQLILTLISRLRRKTCTSGEGLTTEQLRIMAKEVPEELARKVTQTLQQMDEQVRLGELELSLERARVARLASQLEFSRQQVERNARQLGWTLNADGSLTTGTAAANRTSTSRRWLGKLGFSE
jgi:hypothetical protein